MPSPRRRLLKAVILAGRGGTVAESLPSLVLNGVAIVSDELEIDWVENPAYASYEYRHGLLTPPTDGEWQVLDDLVGDLEEQFANFSTEYVQVRGITAGAEAGPPSNVESVVTSGPTLTVTDTADYTTANQNAFSFATAGITPAAGEVCVLSCFGSHNGTTGSGAVMAYADVVAAGWKILGEINPTSGTNARGARIIAKVLDGTETTVALMTGSGAGGTVSNRRIWCAATFGGLPEGFTIDDLVLTQAFLHEVTNDNPATQTIPSGSARRPHLAIMGAGAGGISTMTDNTYNAVPDVNIHDGDNSPSAAWRMKIRMVQGGDGQADFTCDLDDRNSANSLISGCLEIR